MAVSFGVAPFEEPQLAVASDGSLAALHEAGRIVLLELPSGAAFAEIAVDPDAAASEIAWVGTPPRLLVLSRYAAHSTVHMLDPSGPRSISEIRLELPMRLAAAINQWALVIGPLGAAVLSTSDSHIIVYPFSTRNVPLAVGAAGGQFVVALASSIEEWDPQSRLPKRRLRLPRAAAITAVGGSDRLVWMITQQEPARIDVIPLVNRGQPRAHELPEPIARIASHPRSEIVACLGAQTGRLYIVDLDGRYKLRTIGPEDLASEDGELGTLSESVGFDAIGMLLGRTSGVLVVQGGRPVAIVPHTPSRDASEQAVVPPPAILPRGEPVRDPPVRVSMSEPALRLPADDVDAEPSAPVSAAPPGSSLADPDPMPEPVAPPPVAASGVAARFRAPPAGEPSPPPSPSPPSPSSPPSPPSPPSSSSSSGSRPAIATPPLTATRPAPPASTSERFSAWRDQARHNQRPAPITASAPPGQAGLPPVHADARLTWRDEVVAWTRAVIAGAIEHNPPAAPRIDALRARFDLALQLQPVLVLLYGAHLCGERGVAPIDVARVLDRQWDEALGRGELAQRGVAAYLGSRVLLSPIVLRALDELAPTFGPLIGEPGGPTPLLGPCVVVASADEPLVDIAERCQPRLAAAILVAYGEPDLADLVFEARAYGAAPLVRVADAPTQPPREPVILVLDDAGVADQLALPRLA